ncbi:hypothetical protein LINGRAHAP2_LOCUS16928 [Linum grandiflorum]
MKQKKAAANPADDEQCSADVEILKAVAQAWYSRSCGSSSSPTSEYDAGRRGNLDGRHRPSRFRIEAALSAARNQASGSSLASRGSWDFRKSLLDSYEIVTVSKKLEEKGISLDGDDVGGPRMKRESKSSLRNLLNRMSSSSKRFTL